MHALSEEKMQQVIGGVIYILNNYTDEHGRFYVTRYSDQGVWLSDVSFPIYELALNYYNEHVVPPTDMHPVPEV